MNSPMDKAGPNELKLHQQNSSGPAQTRPYQPKKPAKYQSSGHPAEGPAEPRINNRTFNYNDGTAQADDTRISDLFSPARGRHAKSGHPKTTAQSQMNDVKHSSEGVTAFVSNNTNQLREADDTSIIKGQASPGGN